MYEHNPGTRHNSIQVPPYSEAATSLLRTNERPRPCDEALAHAEIEHGEKIRDTIDIETEKLEEQIKSLQETLKGL